MPPPACEHEAGSGQVPEAVSLGASGSPERGLLMAGGAPSSDSLSVRQGSWGWHTVLPGLGGPVEHSAECHDENLKT